MRRRRRPISAPRTVRVFPCAAASPLRHEMWRGSGRRGEHAHGHADVPLAQTGVTAACTCTFGSSGVSHATLTRVLVEWPCAAFGIGNAITKACPPDFVRLDNAAVCLFAANAARKTYTVVEFSFYLSGCYWHAFTDRVYYNVYAGTVQNESYAQPLCAGAAGSPTRTHARRHAVSARAASLRRCGRACPRKTRARSNAVSARAQALNCTRRREFGHTYADPSGCIHKQTNARTYTHKHTRAHARTSACTTANTCAHIDARLALRLARAHSCGRCGGGHGDPADVQPTEWYRPRTPRVFGTGSSTQTARWLVCMHVEEHTLSPPGRFACTCIAVRKPRTNAGPTCPRQRSRLLRSIRARHHQRHCLPENLRQAHHGGRMQERFRCGEQDVRRQCGLLALPVWVLLAHYHRQRLLQLKSGRRGQPFRAAAVRRCGLTRTRAQTYTALAPRTPGRLAGAAATAPTFSPAAGMILPPAALAPQQPRVVRP